MNDKLSSVKKNYFKPLAKSLSHHAGPERSSLRSMSPIADEVLHSPGQRLDAQTREFMETRLGHDFSQVQVHSDSNAGKAAQSFGALAFTVGHDIAFQPGLYNPQSLQGRRLLAHELTHVVQQSGASGLKASRISPAGDRYELEAERAASQLVEGKSVAVQPSNNVPLVQRQPAPGNAGVPHVGGITRSLSQGAVTRSECEAALADFLRQAQRTQGARSLQVTPAIRAVLQRLVNLPDPSDTGPNSGIQRAFRSSGLEQWLEKGFPSTDPAEFAHQTMRFIPDPCSAEAIRILGKAPKADPTPGTIGRVGDLIKKSAPAEKSEDQKKLEEQRQPTSAERFEQFEEDQRRRSGVQEKKIGPIQFDVTRAIRILGGLSDTLKGPKKPKPQPAELPPEVISAISKVSRDALTPRGSTSGAYADAQEVATGLAQELDSAHNAGQDQVVLQLGVNYNSVPNQEPIFTAIRQIAEQMRNALPHHAPGVRSVNVVFGDRLVRVLPLGPSQIEPKK